MTRMEQERLDMVTGQRDALLKALASIADDLRGVIQECDHDHVKNCVLVPIDELTELIYTIDKVNMSAAQFEARGGTGRMPGAG